MNVALIVAGCLGILAAAVHGAGGEALVVRKLSMETLAPSPFGGPRMTMAMLHVSWHVATIAFLATGVTLLLAGTTLDGEAAEAAAVTGAAAFSGYAAVVVGLGWGYMRSPRNLLTHPGPGILTGTAVLAWIGAL